MMKSPQSFHDIISQPGSRLAQINLKLKKLATLEQLLRPIIQNVMPIPQYPTPPYHVANFEQNRITLAAENSCLATQIRYRCPVILQQLRRCQDWAMVKKIDIIVSRHNARHLPPDPLLAKRTLSASNANKLHAAARAIHYPPLKQVLQTLANRAPPYTHRD